MHSLGTPNDPEDVIGNQYSSLGEPLSNLAQDMQRRNNGDMGPVPISGPPPLPPRKSADATIISFEPQGANLAGRRKLLLIYIHGFMGAEDSFRKFPAHVHNVISDAVAESHVVYSKIYPRYKSRRAMSAARHEFSEWLAPHEADDTDIILLGHSLGGILAAEVALAENEGPTHQTRLRHRLLGTINFDVPFLGLHPSVVCTGLSSLFHPRRVAESPQNEHKESALAESSVSFSSVEESSDFKEISIASWYGQIPNSNYDPPFPNDVHRIKRNQIEGALNFLQKNSGSFRSAVKEYANSYFEFGGCLADYSGLRRRYALLKELDAVQDFERRADNEGKLQRRLRFVNYYTASPGFPKKSPAQTLNSTPAVQLTQSSQASISESVENLVGLPSPAISDTNTDEDSIDDHLTEVEPLPMERASQDDQLLETMVDQLVLDEDGHHKDGMTSNEALLSDLPPLPEIPPAPPAFNTLKYTDTEVLKQAQKEQARLLKMIEKIQKERDKTLKERERLLQKLYKKAKSESIHLQAGLGVESNNDISPSLEARDSEVRQGNSPYSSRTEGETRPLQRLDDMDDRRYHNTPPPYVRDDSTASSSPAPSTLTSAKKSKDRVFCLLPSSVTKRSSDSLWVRIFIPDVDQVIAHQSIFLPNGLYYEWLVHDTAARIEQWVQDDCTRRAVWEQYGEIS